MSCCDQPGLMPLETGLQMLLAAVTPTLETEKVSLQECAHRVLAEDVFAQAPVPGFDNSAMDGYAIQRNGVECDIAYPIQGKSFAGKPYTEQIKPGHAIRIMTGAAIPPGADCVIMQENTVATDSEVTFKKLANVGNNIRKQGEDIPPGHLILNAGCELKAAHLALLASVGCEAVTVYKKTRVALLSTGDELKTPGEALAFGDIYNSNGPALTVMLNNLNVELIDYGVIEDDPDLFRQAFLKADQECDFVITSGGVSVGEADYTKDILEEIGQINFWKLAIKPGKPFAFGELPNSYFIGLPGNPVSAMVTFHILGSQAIRQHQHLGCRRMPALQAVSSTAIQKSPGRMDFQRGKWQWNGKAAEVALTKTAQGSHILTSLADANCYIALEEDRGDVAMGETVTIWLFDQLI
ncbi:gephyrin-like molybdotransferase Glp [Reinekea sp. G2M2-21]|uniref:molybdopterin molybdotransferase MoeA n=1 Tax=Reinekea sp. G2M2-21 TaxID=2788942 RepID=UPI0018A8B600|nr:gephyrin-like molybdotransferase Glp [Reinekea sp. G2M2-21]